MHRIESNDAGTYEDHNSDRRSYQEHPLARLASIGLHS
jgi:hypothetical protein